MLFQLRDAEDDKKILTPMLRAMGTEPEESEVQFGELQETENRVRP